MPQSQTSSSPPPSASIASFPPLHTCTTSDDQPLPPRQPPITRNVISLSCPHCTKVFGKRTKLERHLQTCHPFVTLSVPSDILCSRTKTTILAALEQANTAFDTGSHTCPRCTGRCFASRKDLACHIVAKHHNTPMDGSTPSAASQRGKRKLEEIEEEDEIQKVDKRQKVIDDGDDVKPSCTKPPVTPKKVRVVLPPKTQALAAAASASPPVTPEKVVTPTKAAKQNVVPVPTTTNSINNDPKTSVSPAPAPAPIPAKPRPSPASASKGPVLDFSAMAGIFTNSHKSYYRLVNS